MFSCLRLGDAGGLPSSITTRPTPSVLQRNLWRHRGRHCPDVVVLRVEPCCAIGAELNAEIEHASPDGKEPGERKQPS